MIILIAALSKNYVLGKDNKLIWHLPDDFKRFKELTTGKQIIMGRKTFESLPSLLPNREHIIITRNDNYQNDNCIVVNTLEDALSKIKKDTDAYIIGGGEIYKQSIDYADKLELTIINEDFEGDTYFPDFDKNKWYLLSDKHHTKDDSHKYDFNFLTYIKKTKI